MDKNYSAVLAGATTSCAMFVFFDGMLSAKASGYSYNFLMWIPQLLSFCGIFLMVFVDAKLIMTRSSDDVDEKDEMKAKSLFFFGAVFLVGSLFAAMLRLSDMIGEDRDPWPGISLVLQSILFIVCTILIFGIKTAPEDEDDW